MVSSKNSYQYSDDNNHPFKCLPSLISYESLNRFIATKKIQNNKWVVPKDANNLKNPMAVNASVLKEGKTIYMSFCTPCHGDKGRGDGVAAASLSTKPADHSSDNVQKQTDGALFWMITEGRN